MEGQRLRGSMGLDWNPMQVVALSVAPVLLWYVARRRNTRYTLAYALALGVVGSPRLLLYELALALPFITTLGIEASILFGVALATVVTPAVLVGRIAMVVIELIPLSGAALGWVAWIREAVTEVFPLRQGHE